MREGEKKHIRLHEVSLEHGPTSLSATKESDLLVQNNTGGKCFGIFILEGVLENFRTL